MLAQPQVVSLSTAQDIALSTLTSSAQLVNLLNASGSPIARLFQVRGGSRLFVKGGFEFAFMSILHFLAKKIYIVRANMQLLLKFQSWGGGGGFDPPTPQPHKSASARACSCWFYADQAEKSR